MLLSLYYNISTYCTDTMIKLAIVGGRDYTHYENFKKIVNQYISEIGTPVEIISGAAKGVDTLAAMYAKEHNIPMKEFPPEVDKYDFATACKLRNTQIIERATHVLALPSIRSTGTYDSIRKANRMSKELKVVTV